jgi:hypothetical protein
MPTFIEFSTTTIAGILSVAGDVLVDLKLPVVLLLGLWIGFAVIDLIIGLVRRKTATIDPTMLPHERELYILETELEDEAFEPDFEPDDDDDDE